MAAPQHWLIKDTERSDSGKFMLISSLSAQPPFWDTISACLNIQISRDQDTQIKSLYSDLSPTLGSICTPYIWAIVKTEGKYGESERKQGPQECFWHANHLHESYETYEHYKT